MSEDFVVRWSRRKNEARRAGCGSTPQPDRPAGLTPDARPEATAAEAAITPEELAALPRLDELTAETDISGFLHRGVPETLRNAALRKMWMLDPAIRDFVGHACDYAYDWNTPGGVPGNGPLEPEHVAAMVRRVFAGTEAVRPGHSGTEPADDPARAGRGTAADPAAALQKEAPREDGRRASDGSETASGAPPGTGGTATRGRVPTDDVLRPHDGCAREIRR